MQTTKSSVTLTNMHILQLVTYDLENSFVGINLSYVFENYLSFHMQEMCSTGRLPHYMLAG